MNSPAQPQLASTSGSFNYLADDVEHSLYRNGAVLTRRDRDGSDAGTEGVLLDAVEKHVIDARSLSGGARRSLKSHGFELLDRPMADKGLDFYDHVQVAERYYPECADIVRAATGAKTVLAFDHNIRSASGKERKERIAGGQQVQGPAHVVHGDYTLTSAPQRLRDLCNPPGLNDTLRSILAQDESLLQAQAVDEALAEGNRFAIINLWRSIAPEPVVTNPLALCDGQSVEPKDLVVFEIHYHDRVGENYFAKHAERHEWYYYPEMLGHEALLIKQWDSAGELARSRGARADADAAGEGVCSFSFHSAFRDPMTAPDAPDRRSIEVRCVVLYT